MNAPLHPQPVAAIDKREIAARVADELNGSCNSLLSALGEDCEHLQDDAEFCAELDSRVFLCEQCGWWDEICNMAEGDEWICEDCAE